MDIAGELDYQLFRVRSWWYRMKEKALFAFVWRLPREVIYLAIIRAWAHATQGKWSDQVVSEVTILEMLDRWDDHK